MARYELKLPQMGESVEEAIVSSWLKNVGDTIKVDDILVEVATDKVDSEIPSEVSGVIKEILTPVKSVVKVGQVMAIIETEQQDEIQVELLSETPQPILPIEEIPSQPIELELPPQPTVAAPTVPPIQEVPATPTEEVSATPTEKEPALPQEEETVAAQVPYVPQAPVVLPETSQEETNEPFYSPLVKTIAKEENISMDELAAIEGSGIDGRVTKHDLLRYLERRNKTTTTPVSVVASTPTPTASAPTPVSEPTVATTEATSLALPTTTELTTQITDVALIDNKLGGSPFSVAAVAESQPAPVAESQSAPVVESQPADGLSAVELLMQQKEAAKKDSQEPTPAPVVQEEVPAPVVAQEEAPAPVVAQEEAPAPVVAQEEVPAPVVAQEEVPAPVVAQAEASAPVVAQEEAPAPVVAEAPAPAAQQEKTEVQEVKYPDISDFIKNFEATHPKETPAAEKPVTEETPEKQPQPITIEPTPITLEVPQDKPEEKPVVASTTYTPSPVDKNVEVIEMTRMGKLIANYMIESKRVSAHATSFIEVDVTRIWNWRNKHKKAFESREGEKLTFTPIFIEAVAKALRDFPLMNISTDGERIFKKKQINIGMATALPNGDLIVPVIKNADQLSLVGLAKNVNDLAKRARENKLKPDEVKEGTYTVTNIGAFGNLFGTPILNQPQVGILAIGAIQKVPAVVETPEGDVIAIRYKLMLSHSFDHRVVNGALGGMFVQRVAKYLEQWDVNREI